MIKPAILAIACVLSACTSQQTVYRPLTIPAGLVTPVAHPDTPNPATATQRDVALFVIEQRQAIDLCNAQLTTIKSWSDGWTSQTARSN